MDDEQLFICVQCRHVDVVDLAHTRFLQYRQRAEALRVQETPIGVKIDDLEPLPEYKPFHCTHCLTQEWHGLFPYLPYNPVKDRVCNPPLPVC